MREYSYAEACDKLNEAGDFLTVRDFTDTVYVATHDSIQIYSSGLVKRYGPWVMIWTEHNGYQVLHNEDLEQFAVYKSGSVQWFSVGIRDEVALGASKSLAEIPELT